MRSFTSLSCDFPRTMLSSRWSFGWNSSAVMELDRRTIDYLSAQLAEATALFSPENTWVVNTFGVPSLFTRVDHVHDSVIEFEDKPCGMGLGKVSPEFAHARDAFIGMPWPHGIKIFSVESPTRVSDDEAWFGRASLSLEEGLRTDGFVVVRSRPNETEYHQFAPRSISTIAHEGDKSYGVTMGLWRVVRPEDFGDDSPLWQTQFVLKPIVGTRANDICVWIPEGDLRRGPIKNNRTKGQIRRIVSGRGSMFLQNYVPHELCPFAEQVQYDAKGVETRIPWPVLHRSYFFWNPQRAFWEHIYSFWVATPELPVHGTDKAISGPIRIV